MRLDYMDVVDRLSPVLNQVVRGHVIAYRATHGLVGHRFPGAPPMLVLDHVGAKTGAQRTCALAYLADGDDLVLVASKGGSPRHPAWFHNLCAHPDTTVQVGSDLRAVRAHVATPKERARLWPKVVDLYGGYRHYQGRTRREIPLVILEPRKPDRQ
jgi:F420H(2)-dependent quinone reductase